MDAGLERSHKPSCGLNVGGSQLQDPTLPQHSRPDGAPTGRFLNLYQKVFDLVGPVWQELRRSKNPEPRLTEAEICQRFWLQPITARLEAEEGEGSDVEEDCVRHPGLHLDKVKEKNS